jgi:putative two-component system response regulator
MAERIALMHHERWDGTGYPGKLRGEEIPLAGRIVSVADVFDALTHERPYKSAWTVEEALAEIGLQGGRQFDPRIVEAFLSLHA